MHYVGKIDNMYVRNVFYLSGAIDFTTDLGKALHLDSKEIDQVKELMPSVEIIELTIFQNGVEITKETNPLSVKSNIFKKIFK
jgi:hypothetical protein